MSRNRDNTSIRSMKQHIIVILVAVTDVREFRES